MLARAPELAFELWEASTTKLPFPEPESAVFPGEFERNPTRLDSLQLPRVTLLVSSPDGERVAGFAMRAPLATCVSETNRVQRWAQSTSGELFYVLTVGKHRRLVRCGETLTSILEQLYSTETQRAESATTSTR